MNAARFPLIATAVSIVLVAVLVFAGSRESGYALPLLTLLLISEFGFLVAAAGAYFGFREWFANGFRPAVSLAAIACIALSLWFAVKGYLLWEYVNALKG